MEKETIKMFVVVFAVLMIVGCVTALIKYSNQLTSEPMQTAMKEYDFKMCVCETEAGVFHEILKEDYGTGRSIGFPLETNQTFK